MEPPSYFIKKLIKPENIERQVAEIRASGKTIATLNGSFDLLHAGHLFMIHQAKQQADILIVALNSDASVRAYKSPKRPIIPLQYRLEMMAALEFVDFVTFFEEVTPCNILYKIRPEVHVNGIEYGENCVEAGAVRAVGARLHLVARIPSLSTSAIIEKICEVSAP